MAILVGSARIDENGRIAGGAVGDQTGKEVSTQAFYVHSQGWIILRAKNVAHANAIAKLMLAACNNANLGYDQNNRLGVVKYGINTKTKTECDCSSLVRQCVKEATGKDPGNFTTGNEASELVATGLFEKITFVSLAKTPVYNGDILVTKTKGHTVVVVSGNPRPTAAAGTSGSKKTVEEIAKEVIAGKWGSGNTRKTKLEAAGYNYATVQAKVNELLKGKSTTASAKKSIDVIAKEVIAGKWGNGSERKKKLTTAGYDYAAVQKKVNKLL